MLLSCVVYDFALCATWHLWKCTQIFELFALKFGFEIASICGVMSTDTINNVRDLHLVAIYVSTISISVFVRR